MRMTEEVQGFTPLVVENAVEIRLSPDNTLMVTFLREDGLKIYRTYRRDLGAHYIIVPEGEEGEA